MFEGSNFRFFFPICILIMVIGETRSSVHLISLREISIHGRGIVKGMVKESRVK